MSHFNNQQQTPVSYPPPAPYVTAPPPMGYPSKDGSEGYPQQRIPDQTTSRGDGFWKGCCAAICCCCALDICF